MRSGTGPHLNRSLQPDSALPRPAAKKGRSIHEARAAHDIPFERSWIGSRPRRVPEGDRRPLLGGRDINYYLALRPWNGYVAVAIGGVLGVAGLLLVAWLFVRWLFAFPAVVFENASPLEAMRMSWRRTQNRFWSVACAPALWWLAVSAASLATGWLIETGATRLLSNAGLSLSAVLPAVLGALALLTTTDLAWFIAGKIGYSLLVVGLIVFEAVGDPLKADVDFVSMNAARVTPRFVRKTHKQGRQVHVWTVNDPNNALAMMEMGADNIITDNPAGMRRLLRAWNELSDAERIALMLRRLVQGKNLPLPAML